jgi:hypothetical protein
MDLESVGYAFKGNGLRLKEDCRTELGTIADFNFIVIDPL